MPVRLAYEINDELDTFPVGLAADDLSKVVVTACPIIDSEVGANGLTQVALVVATCCYKNLVGTTASGDLNGSLPNSGRAGVDKY